MATFPTFPNLDFSALDAGKLAELDDKIAAAVRDAAYVAIGFGVLAVQQAQVRRRELVSALKAQGFKAVMLATLGWEHKLADIVEAL